MVESILSTRGGKGEIQPSLEKIIICSSSAESFCELALAAHTPIYLGREALCQQLVEGGADLLRLQVETAAQLLVFVLDVPAPPCSVHSRTRAGRYK